MKAPLIKKYYVSLENVELKAENHAFTKNKLRLNIKLAIEEQVCGGAVPEAASCIERS